MAKVRESDFITKNEIDYMVKSGKRYFSGTWQTYDESPYAEYKRFINELLGKEDDIRD